MYEQFSVSVVFTTYLNIELTLLEVLIAAVNNEKEESSSSWNSLLGFIISLFYLQEILYDAIRIVNV